MPQTNSKRSQAELTATVIAAIMQNPRHWTSGTLAEHLGESQPRVNRVLQAIEAAGWLLERTETGKQRYTLLLVPPAMPPMPPKLATLLKIVESHERTGRPVSDTHIAGAIQRCAIRECQAHPDYTAIVARARALSKLPPRALR